MPEDRCEICSMAKDNAGSPVVWLTWEKVLERGSNFPCSQLLCRDCGTVGVTHHTEHCCLVSLRHPSAVTAAWRMTPRCRLSVCTCAV